MGPGEPYSISVCGVPGALYVTAPEFDAVGAFSTVEEALEGIEEAWGGVSLFTSEEEAWANAKREGYV